MTFNYYFHTNDESIKEKLLEENQLSDFEKIKEIVGEKGVTLTEDNIVAVGVALVDAGFKVKHYRKYFAGDIGVGQCYYKIMQEDYSK